ncbi:MAG: 3-hydroxyacyl-CoA dehydrogenase family protein [Myxococcales bacterium]|nr:3-hydroxyacyl-CoA dehydrogenase family protein [Myxococcales bacterium]
MSLFTPADWQVCVIGAGTMGHGIAQVIAMTGARTCLHDVSGEAIDRGLAKVRANLDKGVARGKVDEAVLKTTLQALRGDVDLAAAVGNADLIIEAVPELPDLKKRIFRSVAAHSKPGAIFASNTSSIPLARLAEAVPDPARFIGMHFFNPVHIQPLLELVRATTTSDETLDAIVSLAKAMGKDPIVVADSPGFASSRLGLALGLEAIRMLEEGVASAADIDKAMQLGYRHPMGPLKLTDLIGLDVRLAIAETLAAEIDATRFAPPPLLRKLVAEGKLGKKSGEGFYRYD